MKTFNKAFKSYYLIPKDNIIFLIDIFYKDKGIGWTVSKEKIFYNLLQLPRINKDQKFNLGPEQGEVYLFKAGNYFLFYIENTLNDNHQMYFYDLKYNLANKVIKELTSQIYSGVSYLEPEIMKTSFPENKIILTTNDQENFRRTSFTQDILTIHLINN